MASGWWRWSNRGVSSSTPLSGAEVLCTPRPANWKWHQQARRQRLPAPAKITLLGYLRYLATVRLEAPQSASHPLAPSPLRCATGLHFFWGTYFDSPRQILRLPLHTTDIHASSIQSCPLLPPPPSLPHFPSPRRSGSRPEPGLRQSGRERACLLVLTPSGHVRRWVFLPWSGTAGRVGFVLLCPFRWGFSIPSIARRRMISLFRRTLPSLTHPHPSSSAASSSFHDPTPAAPGRHGCSATQKNRPSAPGRGRGRR